MHAPLIKQGWLRVLLFLILLIAVTVGVQAGLPGVLDQISNPLLLFMASYAVTAIGLLLLTLLFKRLVDREAFLTVGLSWPGYKYDGGMGLFTATAILCLGSLILSLADQVIFMGIGSGLNDVLMMLGMMVIVAFVEEIVFRGYILYNLMASMNKWIALVISAVLFAAIHSTNPNVGVLPIVNVFLAGLLLGINYLYTRNLWFAILFHLGWNFLQGAVLGYEVSGIEMPHLLTQYATGTPMWTGGEFGFEGSLLCTLLLLITILAWTYLFAQKYKSNPAVS